MDISIIATSCQPITENSNDEKKKRWYQDLENNIRNSAIQVISQLVSVILIYAALWGVLGYEVLPQTEMFSLFVLIIVCSIGGKVAQFIYLPPLLGMLLVGFMLRNIPGIHISEYISVKWGSILRNSALVVILLRAGMGLNPVELRRLSMVCLRLAFTPCLVETVITGTASHFLIGLPWTWSLLLGFVISAVSPAIVVPSMLDLREKGLGEKKGIPTLIIAAASCDDVVAITGFGVMLGITFSTGNLTWTILKGPLEVLVGLAYGGVLGVISWYIPYSKMEKLVLYRFIVLFFGGITVMFVSQRLDFAGAGALGCLGLSFVAVLKWRTDTDENHHIEGIHAGIWDIFQPLLFGLIGIEVSVGDIEQDVGLGVLALLIGLTVRMLTTFLVTFGAGLKLKERVFISFAWIPKATVQAAIGSVALDYARTTSAGVEMEKYGKMVLTIAVLSILITAPVGAAAISLLAPLLLKDSSLDVPLNQNSCNVVKKATPDYGACDENQAIESTSESKGATV